MALVVAFLLIQIAAPLRHFAHPGNVRWTEDGCLFSWKVMLAQITGSVRYRSSGLDTSEEMLVSPWNYLFLSTAHIIHNDLSVQGFTQVEIRADAWFTYNRRNTARLIYPAVNPAYVEAGTGLRN